MVIIDQSLISRVTEEARKSARLRKNFNFHPDHADPVNRMLNALEPGTYVRPHKHESPDKWEVFLAISGKALVLRFDEAGTILEAVILDPTHGVHGVEIGVREWHTVVALVPGTVLYEIKPGPYTPLEDKNFASWAPSENSPEAAAYLESLLHHFCLA